MIGALRGYFSLHATASHLFLIAATLRRDRVAGRSHVQVVSFGQFVVSFALFADADAPIDATYSNFTSSRVIHAPTDIIQITARDQVFNQSDTPTAARLLDQITISPYNTSGV